jgi:hypothetical protein
VDFCSAGGVRLRVMASATPGTPPARLLDQLRKIEPATFEQLTFDLMVAVGLRNAVWRSPGADGGRDIEGDFLFTDLSNTVSLQRWYIECKRYADTLDWPSVYNKIAYASNRGASHLFLITTALLSPQCKSEVTHHEAQAKRPSIRFWDAPVLEGILSTHPRILVKYGLQSPEQQTAPALVPLALATARAVQAAYGFAATTGEPDPALEFAASVAELLWSCSRLASDEAPFRVIPFSVTTDLYPWCTIGAGLSLVEYDQAALRAVLSGVRYMAGAQSLTIASDASGDLRLTPGKPRWPLDSDAAVSTLSSIAFWSNFSLSISPTDVGIKRR